MSYCIGDIPEITNSGYEFMLIDISEQIWAFMRYYTQEAEKPVDVLQMMFQMNFCIPGMPCSSQGLTDIQKDLLDDFKQFGLIFKNDDKDDIFYPTSLGVNVVFGRSKHQQLQIAQKSLGNVGAFAETQNGQDSSLNQPQDKVQNNSEATSASGMFVIVETNFKCYVYTQSSLHIEMLKLFLNIECILPNLVVGLVTRKVRRNVYN